MSYHEGSNWQAKKEDEKKPLYENPPTQKKKTPLQEAIEQIRKSRMIISNGVNKPYNDGIDLAISTLKSLLSKEKEFAKEMYLEGMVDHGYDNAKFLNSTNNTNHE